MQVLQKFQVETDSAPFKITIRQSDVSQLLFAELKNRLTKEMVLFGPYSPPVPFDPPTETDLYGEPLREVLAKITAEGLQVYSITPLAID